MEYDVRYKGVVAGSFFGRFLHPGQSFRTGASLAVELHTDGTNKWECPDFEKAKAELANPTSEPTVVDLGVGISIDEVPGTPHVEPSGTTATDLFLPTNPSIDSSLSSVSVVPVVDSSVPCDQCSEKFPSKKKFAAHKAAVHSGSK